MYPFRKSGKFIPKAVLEAVLKPSFCQFSGSFKPIFDSILGGNINFRILPPKMESKIGQNNPKNQRSLGLRTVSKQDVDLIKSRFKIAEKEYEEWLIEF